MAFKKTGETQEIKEIYCSCGEKLVPGSKVCPKCKKNLVSDS